MFLLCSYDAPSTEEGWNIPDSTMRVAAACAGAVAAAVVPAHSFVINRMGMQPTADPMSIMASPFASWMRTFLGACAWAFMIAAGSLVYSHFVKKWQASGLPMLPVAALVTGVGAAQPLAQAQTQTQSAGGLPSGPQFQRARPPGQTSFLEEYEV